MKNRYMFKATQNALSRRLQILEDNLVDWQQNMVVFLRGVLPFVPEVDRYFRWHDSGDVQSIAHLDAIVEIARAVPQWRFWLPTKEYAMLTAWRKAGNTEPENLCIRVSHPMRNARGSALKLGPGSGQIDGSKAETARALGRLCPAPKQGNVCGSCRACWDSRVSDVFYVHH